MIDCKRVFTLLYQHIPISTSPSSWMIDFRSVLVSLWHYLPYQNVFCALVVLLAIMDSSNGASIKKNNNTLATATTSSEKTITNHKITTTSPDNDASSSRSAEVGSNGRRPALNSDQPTGNLGLDG